MTSRQMTPDELRWFLTGFPLFFVGLWLVISQVVGVMSGWYQMMAAYPDRPEAPLRRFSFQSGSMGARVSLGNILRIEVCPSGLRFGIMRLFGLWCRDFFVPWDQITVAPKRMFLVSAVEMQFGDRDFPKLIVRAALADRIAGVAPGQLKLAEGVAA